MQHDPVRGSRLAHLLGPHAAQVGSVGVDRLDPRVEPAEQPDQLDDRAASGRVPTDRHAARRTR